MKHCERFEEHLSAWLDDELERADQVEWIDHLVRCSACREFTIQARSLDGLIATVRPPRDAVEPSPDLWNKIQSTTTAASIAPAPASSLWYAGLRAAAVLVLSVGLGALFMSGPETANTGYDPAEIRLGENSGGMDDSRFMQLTTEVLRADPRYHDALYKVMEQVVRETGSRETSSEYFVSDDEGDEPTMAELVNRNPV
jgi:hypothetical protein